MAPIQRTEPDPPAPAAGPRSTGPSGSPRGPRRRARRVAQRTIAVVPTLFTLGNLLCGFMAIFIASRPADTPLPFDWPPLNIACILIGLGMVCDGLDGGLARLTRSHSDLGAQLDSLADMVTFGAAPAFVLIQTLGINTPFVAEAADIDTYFDRIGVLVAMVFVACAGLRLARFNAELNAVDDDADDDDELEMAHLNGQADGEPHPGSSSLDDADDHHHFRGMPSPGAAATLIALVVLHRYTIDEAGAASLRANLAAGLMLTTALLCALAMVSRMPYAHVLNLYVRQRAPFHVVAIAVIIGLLSLVLPQLSFALAAFAYAASGPVLWLLHRRRDGCEADE